MIQIWCEICKEPCFPVTCILCGAKVCSDCQNQGVCKRCRFGKKIIKMKPGDHVPVVGAIKGRK